MRYSRLGYWGASAAGVVLALGGAVAVVFGMPPGVYWAKFAAFTFVIIGAVWVVLLAYRSADEVMLGEHKTAWFWGGMIMLSLVGPLAVGIVWRLVPMPLIIHAMGSLRSAFHAPPPPAWIPQPSQPQLYFLEGMVFVVIAQLVAFLVVLACLRLRPAKQ
ncbi:MAG TPA: hypothetical protein VMU01_06090 [Rhizomicrobium sp.]|nr:hypothetical protein [Rhizomicrobium sp.]